MTEWGRRLALAATAGWLSTGCADAQSADPDAAGGPPLVTDTALVRLLSEIQPTVERSSGISATRPLHVAATDERRLRTYIERQLETQLPAEEAAAITAVYARLGLVPDTLDLPALVAALLQEQVIGYYDPASDTLFVHERVPIAQLEPVLAHELVHALQDQYMALDSARTALEDRNDALTAYQAVIEGHATFAMMEWQFTAVTGSEADLTAMPDLGEMLEDVDLSALGDFGSTKVLEAAPAVIREGLLFPYLGGLAFVQRAWKARPERPLPFGSDLPRSTEQILHLDRWLEADEPTALRFANPPPRGWDVVYENDLGELETRIFLEEHLGDETRARAAAAGWDGDAYRLLRRQGVEGLVWTSVWDSPEDADEFAAAARAAYAVRYARLPGAAGGAGPARGPRIERGQAGGRALVRIVDFPEGAEPGDDLAAIVLDRG